jgi:hypothetical protein
MGGAALCLVLLAGVASVQERTALERWTRMSDAERAEIQRRFEAFRHMDADGQRELERRMLRLRELEERARREMPRELAAELEELDHRQRAQLVREMVEHELSERGRDLYQRLPPEWRRRFEEVHASDRRGVLMEMMQAHRGDSMLHAIGQLARELDLPPEEVRRLQSLAPEEREAELLDLHRRALERRVEEGGLPSWIAPEEWAAWRELSAREFHERFQQRKREAGLLGFASPLGPAPGRGEPWREPPPGMQELRRRMRPDPLWRLELRDLDPEERGAEVDRRVRERVLELLEERDDLRPGDEDLRSLRRLRGRDFMDRVRASLKARWDARCGGPGPDAGGGLRRDLDRR